MKVALVQCPVWGTYDPPMALARLSGCLKKDGHEVFNLDLNIRLYINRTTNYKDMWAWEQSLFWYDDENVDKYFDCNKPYIDKCVNEIINANAKVIGFSVNAASRISSLRIAEMIKKIDKEIIIIFGGPLFFEKRFIEDILNKGVVDIIIPGEGELTLIELVNFIQAKKDISNCAGISFKYNGKIVDTGPRPLISNLDILPFLDFSDLSLSRYDDSRHIVFMASRGCIQNCVFCSSRAFWPGYRAMSGKRIFEEIKYVKKEEGRLNPNLGHVDFIDLLFNGNMKNLIEFCDLLIKEPLDIKWSANMIIRPEMTFDVIRKMKDAGCEHIIFGIESGSQRVLDLMRKHYCIEDADNIIRDMHRVGIKVTGNFMFGFPGETEEDFQQTLDFIRRNAKFLDRAYPSRTYCAIEEYSYLSTHLEEFGIKPNPPNHLFWESVDGTNTYPKRLRRCREFSQVVSYLDIEVGCGVQTSVEQDELFSLYLYYENKRDFKKALEYLLKYFELNRLNEHVKSKLKFFLTKVNEKDPLFVFDDRTLSKLKDTVSIIELREKLELELEEEEDKKFKAYGKEIPLLQCNNSERNNEEFNYCRLILESSPKRFLLEVNGSCESNCIFCRGSFNLDLFSMKAFRSRFEDKISKYLTVAEEIVFTGWGEFLLLPEAEKILDYFDKGFPQARKIFSTNGSSLSPNICDKLISSKSDFTVNVSLHATNRPLHSVLTHTENFNIILERLKYLLKIRKEAEKPAIRLIFIATTLNIDDLPNFVKLAADLGVDEVICRYNYIYNPIQRYLSCFFRQAAANRNLCEAEDMAYRLNIKVDLPPRFGLSQYTDLVICSAPWRQIAFDTRGRVSPCEVLCKGNENLETKNFMEVWNGVYYQNLRKSLIEVSNPCSRHCLFANPLSVNELDAHVIKLNYINAKG